MQACVRRIRTSVSPLTHFYKPFSHGTLKCLSIGVWINLDKYFLLILAISLDESIRLPRARCSVADAVISVLVTCEVFLPWIDEENDENWEQSQMFMHYTPKSNYCPRVGLFSGEYSPQFTEEVRNRLVMGVATTLSQRRAIGLPNRIIYAFTCAAGRIHLYACFFADFTDSVCPAV